MRKIVSGFVALALLLAAAGAPAQSPEPSPRDDPNAALVDELVVNAREAGPAWWRVSKGDATVFILGLPVAAPDNTAFDDTLLRLRLDGANRLILPPSPEVSWLRLAGFWLGVGRAFKQSPPLLQSLPPALAERLRLALAKRGDKPNSMDTLKPAFAGLMLADSDSSGKAVFISNELQLRVAKLARSSAIKVKPRIVKTGGYDALQELKALATLPADAQLACLDDGLRSVESGEGGAAAVAAKWAKGQVRDLVSADRGIEACLSGSPLAAADIRRGMAASTVAIVDALGKPGLSVALVDLRPLLARDGVLDRLRRDGYEVHTPGA
jgi:uncharacterized protein YbaP (TraB family)